MQIKTNRAYLLSLCLCLISYILLGQSEGDLSRATKKITVLTDVNITQYPGQKPFMGNILIKGGLIDHIGENIEVPIGARILVGDSMHVYAGFIDGLSHIGVPQKKAENKKEDSFYKKMGVEPTKTLFSVLEAKENSIEKWRKIGFTMSHTVPRGHMLPGTGAIIFLKGQDENQMILQNEVSQFAQLEVSTNKVYPKTLLGVMAKFRDLYRQAKQVQKYDKLYVKDPTSMQRPIVSPELKSLFPVVNGEQPFYFKGEDLKSIYRILNLKETLEFPVIIGGIKQGWRAVDDLKKKNIPVLLSLDLPEDKAANVSDLTEDEKAMMEQKRIEELNLYRSQAAVFEQKGIDFGFSNIGVNSNHIRKNISKMIESGLSEKTALAALTTTPAKMLGIDNIAGTIEQGKLANLVVTNGPYFTLGSDVRFVIIEGEIFEYKIKTKPKALETESTEVIAAGVWDFTVNTGEQMLDGEIVITGRNDELIGTIINPLTREKVNVEDFNLDANILTFTMPLSNGEQVFTVQYELVINGDNMTGTATAGPVGTFEIESKRQSVNYNENK